MASKILPKMAEIQMPYLTSADFVLGLYSEEGSKGETEMTIVLLILVVLWGIGCIDRLTL